MGAQYSDRSRVRLAPVRITVPGSPPSSVSGVWALPPDENANGDARSDASGTAVLLAHGAGADMNHRFMCAMHEGLAASGALVLKFNYAYIEGGRKAPDPPLKLVATHRAAAAALAAHPEARQRAIVFAGKSMGGRIGSHLVAEGDPADGLLFFGYPLHPAGRPNQLRDKHLSAITCPMLFIEGTRDALCDLALLRPVLERLGSRASLHVIEDGDHSFHVRRSSGRSDAEAEREVLDAAVRWLARLRPSK